MSRGLTRVADVVDHIIPLAMGGSDEDENTRNLCHPCHHEVTGEQFNFAVTGRGVDQTGRPTFSKHPWNLNEGGGGRKSRPPGPYTAPGPPYAAGVVSK